MQLFYAKGKRYFEDAPVFDATIADIDLDFVQAYCIKIGYAKKPEAFLRTNRNFIQKIDGSEKISGAAILLYEFVKEFGEGVDRMFREMEAAGNPAPEY